MSSPIWRHQLCPIKDPVQVVFVGGFTAGLPTTRAALEDRGLSDQFELLQVPGPELPNVMP